MNVGKQCKQYEDLYSLFLLVSVLFLSGRNTVSELFGVYSVRTCAVCLLTHICRRHTRITQCARGVLVHMEPRRPRCSVIYIFPQCVLERFHVSTHLRCLCPSGSMAFQSVDSQRLFNHSWLMGDLFTLANTRGQMPCSCVWPRDS